MTNSVSLYRTTLCYSYSYVILFRAIEVISTTFDLFQLQLLLCYRPPCLARTIQSTRPIPPAPTDIIPDIPTGTSTRYTGYPANSASLYRTILCYSYSYTILFRTHSTYSSYSYSYAILFRTTEVISTTFDLFKLQLFLRYPPSCLARAIQRLHLPGPTPPIPTDIIPDIPTDIPIRYTGYRLTLLRCIGLPSITATPTLSSSRL